MYILPYKIQLGFMIGYFRQYYCTVTDNIHLMFYWDLPVVDQTRFVALIIRLVTRRWCCDFAKYDQILRYGTIQPSPYTVQV